LDIKKEALKELSERRIFLDASHAMSGDQYKKLKNGDLGVAVLLHPIPYPGAGYEDNGFAVKITVCVKCHSGFPFPTLSCLLAGMHTTRGVLVCTSGTPMLTTYANPWLGPSVLRASDSKSLMPIWLLQRCLRDLTRLGSWFCMLGGSLHSQRLVTQDNVLM
jgi:hypothetical protein